MPLSNAARCFVGAMVLGFLAQHTTSVWNGVYTAAQADRGKTVYDTACSRHWN